MRKNKSIQVMNFVSYLLHTRDGDLVLGISRDPVAWLMRRQIYIASSN
jgi:hypothetical protein